MKQKMKNVTSKNATSDEKSSEKRKSGLAVVIERHDPMIYLETEALQNDLLCRCKLSLKEKDET